MGPSLGGEYQRPVSLRQGSFPEDERTAERKDHQHLVFNGLLGHAELLHYVASKAALIGMTRSLAREVGEFGICVNAIAPGLVEHEGKTAPKALTELQLKARSIKRLQTPEDLLGTLIFLASSDSDFMTGQTIVVDGGSVFH